MRRVMSFCIVLVASLWTSVGGAGPNSALAHNLQQENCVLDGSFNLNFLPWGSGGTPFWLVGNFAGEQVSWRVSGFIEYGTLNIEGQVLGLPVTLEATVDDINGANWLHGDIGNTFVAWPGSYGLFSGNTGCIK